MGWLKHLRLSWVLGVAVLAISLIGANRYMHNPRETDADAKDTKIDRQQSRPAGVVCSGLVQPENDVLPLYPSQQGEVVEMFAKSEQVVKKGDKLLRLDDRMATSKLHEAEAGIKAAEATLQKARNGMERWKLEVLGQMKVIQAKRLGREAAKEKLEKAEELLSKGIHNTEAEVRAGRKQIEALAVEIEAEEIKLKVIELSKPEVEITLAEANLDRSKALREQAQMAVDACVLTAPEDGTIMQVFAGVGSKFGPQITKPAFLFYSGALTVRAEVDQEYVNRISEGQVVTIHDQTNSGQTWRGRVTYVAKSFLPKRDTAALTDLFQQNQDRVLECRIAIDRGQELPRLNQKVRVHINMN